MNSPKVQRSRQVTPCYLKLLWKLPEENTSVKVPMHLWLYCPVTELYTPPSAVARLISTNFPGFMGVCASLGDVAAELPAASACRLTLYVGEPLGESYSIQGRETQRKLPLGDAACLSRPRGRKICPPGISAAGVSCPLHTWKGRPPAKGCLAGGAARTRNVADRKGLPCEETSRRPRGLRRISLCAGSVSTGTRFQGEPWPGRPASSSLPAPSARTARGSTPTTCSSPCAA
jgi:hypothetical protein